MKKFFVTSIFVSALTTNLFGYAYFKVQTIDNAIIEKKAEIRILEKGKRCLVNATSKEEAKSCSVEMKQELKNLKKDFFIKNKKMFLKHLEMKSKILKKLKKDEKKAKIILELKKCIEPTKNKMEMKKCMIKYKPQLKKNN